MTNAVESHSKKRRYLRFPLIASVEAIESKSGARVTGRTSDVGLGGCYVDLLSPFAAGADVLVRIMRDKELFEAKTRVVYSTVGMGMGLAFVSAMPTHAQLLQNWLREFDGKTPAAKGDSTQDSPIMNDKGLKEQNFVLKELLIALTRKGVLTETEGKALLGKLNR